MNLKLGLGVVAAAAMTVAVAAPAANARPATTQAHPTISQSYTCQTPLGPESEAFTVTGKASIKGKKITLSKVVYSITNNFGVDLTVSKIKVSVPDPTTKVATYNSGSVTAAKKPKGYKPGHDATGSFVDHNGSMDVANGATIKTAALGATYTATGPKGSQVVFQPGALSFHVTSPVQGDVTCTPDKPVGTIATVTE
jgi:hypothetical protein